MNILFLLRALDLGGLEIVTATLANKFTDEGHHVCVYAFEKRSGMLLDRFSQNVKITIAGKYQVSSENVTSLREVLNTHHIQVVINQWGLPLIPIRILCKAKRGMDVKVFSVYHNDPYRNGRITDVETKIRKTKNGISRALLRCKKCAYRFVTGFSMRYNYYQSDLYAVLSTSYVSHFQQFTWLKPTPKLVVINNPITIKTEGFVYQPELKRKEILYVGRLDDTQKRVFRVIEVWKMLEQTNPDWQLTIVGDGAERENLEMMVSNLNLKNVHFEAIQEPRPYYERATLLFLTSEFEGFPLVLAECMSFGVVPVVYDSFSAVHDIIDDEKNGVIIPQSSLDFNVVLMAEKVQALIADKSKVNKIALSAIEKSKIFSLDKTYQEWMKVMQ